MDVRGRVGHRRGAHREGVTAAVVRSERVDGTVVGGGRGRPGHNSTAVTGIIGSRQVTGVATDDRGLVVGHRDGEARRGRVAVDVRGRVGHRRGAHREGVTAAVVRSERVDGTVVGRRRCRPADQGLTLAGVRGLRDVGRHAGNGRVLVIGHRHIKGDGRRVAVDVRGRVGHRRGADGECVITIMCRGERTDGTVVGRGGGRPGHQCAALTGISRLRQVARISSDGGILVIRHGHREAQACRVAGGIDRRVGHGRGPHLEGIAGAVRRRHDGGTVVRRGRSGPGHCRVAFAGVRRLRHVGRHS